MPEQEVHGGKAASEALAALALRAASVDAMVREACARHLGGDAGAGMAVLAVGGYGRRQLFPHSDVDLLLLSEKEPGEGARKGAIGALVKELWDGGLRVSQSVRTVRECTAIQEGNLELSISLFDMRLVAGDEALYEQLRRAVTRFFHAQRRELTRRLCQSTRARHAKYGATIYHLEPNVKEAPGGLRDLQVLGWMKQLRHSSAEAWPAWSAPEEVEEALGVLALLRLRLHESAGRDQNVLSFDAQEELAVGLAGGDVAGLMRSYFRQARSVWRLLVRWMDEAEERNSALLSQFRAWRSRVSNEEFSVTHERVYFRGAHQMAADPELAMRLFEFVARHGIRLSWDAERRIGQYRERIRRHYEGRKSWPALKAILELPHADVALRAMHESGFLTTILPEWEHTECQVVRDFYHRYTVDEHTLRAIEAICELRRAAPKSHERFVGLLSEVEQPALLLAALLLHDIGKGMGGDSHAEESVRIAKAALERMGMAAEQREVVLQLIEQHLLLSRAVSSRDLEDPETARALAQRIRTVELLKKLTLLTYADISAVNPTAMSPWRLGRLWRAYRVTQREFLRELDDERIPAEKPGAGGREFLEGFPVRYLRTHSAGEIAAHLTLEEERKARGVGVHLERKEGCYQLTVVAGDRPYLFASICGALAAFGMNILRAEAFSNTRQVVLDTFTFEDPHRTLELNPPEVEVLRHTLERVILGRVNVEELLRRRSNPRGKGRSKEAAVGVLEGVSTHSTVIEIIAEDRPGLLYDLARTVSGHGCSIDTVLIDTEAGRALDVFYVTKGGQKLTSIEEQALLAALNTAIVGNSGSRAGQ